MHAWGRKYWRHGELSSYQAKKSTVGFSSPRNKRKWLAHLCTSTYFLSKFCTSQESKSFFWPFLLQKTAARWPNVETWAFRTCKTFSSYLCRAEVASQLTNLASVGGRGSQIFKVYVHTKTVEGFWYKNYTCHLIMLVFNVSFHFLVVTTGPPSGYEHNWRILLNFPSTTRYLTRLPSGSCPRAENRAWRGANNFCAAFLRHKAQL